jgi:hypothetical protein
MTPALEAAALAGLTDSDPAVVADAAALLSSYGSPNTQRALWLALEAWHGRWASRVPELLKAQEEEDGSPDASLDEELVPALRDGIAWILNREDLDRLTSLCLTDGCQQLARQPDDMSRGPRATLITAYGLDVRTRAVRYVLAGSALNTRAQLEIRVAQFPRGTAFTWEASGLSDDADWWPAEQAVEFAGVARLVRRHGLTLTRAVRPRYPPIR